MLHVWWLFVARVARIAFVWLVASTLVFAGKADVFCSVVVCYVWSPSRRQAPPSCFYKSHRYP